MKDVSSVAIVNGENLQGLYIDGVLFREAPMITRSMILEGVGIDLTMIVPDEDWLESQPRYPMSLEDVKLKGYTTTQAQTVIDSWDDKHGPTEAQLAEFYDRFPNHHLTKQRP